MDKSFQKTIDLNKIFTERMGDKARFVPSFLIKQLKHIIQEDRVNKFLWENRKLTGTDWLLECVKYLDLKLKIVGESNLPTKDSGHLYTFVSNHPLGGIDGVVLGSIIGQRYDSRFRYLVNDLLMNLPGLSPLCIPVSKTGRQGRNFPQMVENGFQSNYHILMFPAGICSRRIKGIIHDLPWKKTFISKSVEYKRDVVPIHFSGQNSNFFYRITKICQVLPFKFNIAQIFLVNEMYKNAHKTFRIDIGQPIPWQTFDKSKTPNLWAQWVEDRVYNLYEKKWKTE